MAKDDGKVKVVCPECSGKVLAPKIVLKKRIVCPKCKVKVLFRLVGEPPISPHLAKLRDLLSRNDLLPGFIRSQSFLDAYTNGCELRNKRDFRAAEKAFGAALKSKDTTPEMRMATVYAAAKCAHEYGGQPTISPEFEDDPEPLGVVFVALTVAAHLVADGYSAVAWEDESWNVATEVEGYFYHLKFNSMGGAFFNSGEVVLPERDSPLFEETQNAGNGVPHAYVLNLLLDITQFGSPFPLMGATPRDIVSCDRCGNSILSGLNCRKCNIDFCANCITPPINEPQLRQFQTGQVNMLDMTDKGNRPRCPVCESNVGIRPISEGAQFYVRTRAEGKIQGPFEPKTLSALSEKGKLKPQHQLSLDKSNWSSASTVAQLGFYGTDASSGGNVSKQETAKNVPDEQEESTAEPQVILDESITVSTTPPSFILRILSKLLRYLGLFAVTIISFSLALFLMLWVAKFFFPWPAERPILLILVILFTPILVTYVVGNLIDRRLFKEEKVQTGMHLSQCSAYRARGALLAFIDVLRPKYERLNPMVRLEAISEIDDESILVKLAEKDRGNDVREAAQARLDKIRPNWQHSDPLIRKAAVPDLMKKAVIKQLANDDPDDGVRQAAKERLAQIAEQAESLDAVAGRIGEYREKLRRIGGINRAKGQLHHFAEMGETAGPLLPDIIDKIFEAPVFIDLALWGGDLKKLISQCSPMHTTPALCRLIDHLGSNVLYGGYNNVGELTELAYWLTEAGAGNAQCLAQLTALKQTYDNLFEDDDQLNLHAELIVEREKAKGVDVREWADDNDDLSSSENVTIMMKVYLSSARRHIDDSIEALAPRISAESNDNSCEETEASGCVRIDFPEMQSPVCDTCHAPFAEGEGSVLTTRQVVSSAAYWELIYRAWQASPMGAAMGDDLLEHLLERQCNQPTGWITCDACLSKYYGSLSRKEKVNARQYAEEYWKDHAGGYTPPDGEPVSVAVARKTAEMGWRNSLEEKTQAGRQSSVEKSLPDANEMDAEDIDVEEVDGPVKEQPRTYDLITTCSECGRQFRWNDSAEQEAPFCPNCGYDAVYDGKRTQSDASIHEQDVELVEIQSNNTIVTCDKCGATNRSSGSPLESFMGFTLYRCSECRKSFCAREECVGIITANMPCPHCGKVASYPNEEHPYV